MIQACNNTSFVFFNTRICKLPKVQVQRLLAFLAEMLRAPGKIATTQRLFVEAAN